MTEEEMRCYIKTKKGYSALIVKGRQEALDALKELLKND